MEKFSQWVEKVIGPIAYKFSRNKYINVISNCFIAILPITFIGSFAALFTGINVDAYQAFITNSGIKTALDLIVQFTVGSISLYLVAAVAYISAKKDKHEESAILIGLIALVTFLVVTPLATTESGKFISFAYLGAKGILFALITGLFVSKVFTVCYDKKFYVKMPDGVPPFIAEAYKSLSPACIVLIVVCIVNALTANAGGIQSLMFSVLAAPFQSMSNNFLTKIITQLMSQGLWFFGIHGGNVMGAITNTLYTPGTLENIANYAAGLPLEHMFTLGTDSVVCGSAPLNLAIIIMCLQSKKKEFKEFGKLSFLPTFFAISEPIRFGLPIVLNPYFLIPIVATNVVNYTLAYVLMLVGVMPYPRSTLYTGIPYFVGTIFNIGIVPGIIYSILFFVTSYVIAYPFFKMYEKIGMDGSGSTEE